MHDETTLAGARRRLEALRRVEATAVQMVAEEYGPRGFADASPVSPMRRDHAVTVLTALERAAAELRRRFAPPGETRDGE